MIDIVRVRARRFHALHALLTGVVRIGLATAPEISNHLRADIGLPPIRHVYGPLGLFPTNPFGSNPIAPMEGRL